MSSRLPQDGVADLERVHPGVHRHGVLRGSRNTEVVRGNPVADDQIVETDPESIVTDHFVPIMINADDLSSSEADTLMSRREEAKRVRDIAGIEPAGRHLIEQRLERVVREPVEQRNPEPFLGQLVRRRNAPETRADHHYMRHLSHMLI